MAYGLPSRGQQDWDDELNNSIEALRGDVQAAVADAVSAKSNALYARDLAQNVAEAVVLVRKADGSALMNKIVVLTVNDAETDVDNIAVYDSIDEVGS